VNAEKLKSKHNLTFIKMKKIFLLVAVLVVSAKSFGQFYVSAGGGYAMPMPQSVLGLAETSTTESNIYGTFGTGLNLKLNAGYFFNENLGFELGFTYLMGSNQDIDTYVNGADNSTTTATATAMGLAPTLIYKWDNGLYGKFGFATKVGGQVIAETTAHDDMGSGYTSDTAYTYEVNGKMPFGFTGAMGYEYSFNDNMGLFFELEYLGINVKRDTATMTAYNTVVKNGSTVVATYTLADVPADMKSIVFVDELTSSSPSNAQLTEMSPYSSFGINIGIKYTLGK